jgi:GT2 family glycosyltransferase
LHVYAATRAVSFEVIVVDNASSDGSTAMVSSKYPLVHLICNTANAGFGAANNIGAGAACGRHLMLLNSDALLITDTGAHLAAFLDEHPDAGCVGPRIELMSGAPQPRSFGNAPSLRTLFNDTFLLSSLMRGSSFFPGIYAHLPAGRLSQVGWVSGVCMALPAAAYRQAAGFNPGYFMYGEDMDVCLRLKKLGWNIYHIDDCAVRHLLGGSAKTDDAIVSNSLMQQRHFLHLLGSVMSRPGCAAARLLIAAGLVLRIAAGCALAAAGGKSLLLRTSLARLADLASARSLPCA